MTRHPGDLCIRTDDTLYAAVLPYAGIARIK